MEIIDLSFGIDNGCMTCGTPWHQNVKIERMGTLESVGRNTSRFILGSHSATHMDSPFHFLGDGHGIDKNNLYSCIGPVSCVDFSRIGAGGIVSLEDVKKVKITERMLFAFGWFRKWKTGQYYKDFPFFSEEAVKYLMKSGMKLMALDTPSPDSGGAISEMNDSPNHKILLGSDVVIVEYLCNTDKIDFTKGYEIIALPLKVIGADGCPARVVLRSISDL